MPPSYLQFEDSGIQEVNDLTRPSQAGFQQDEYDKEVQLLRMEENLLFDLVNYLQVVGLIQTNTKGSSATTK